MKIAHEAFEAEMMFQQAMQRQELRIARDDTREFKQIVICIMVFLVVCLISLTLIIRLYLRNARICKKLQELNQDFSLQNEELNAQEKALSQANENLTFLNEHLDQLVSERTKVEDQKKQLEHFAFMNAHEIRGPLSNLPGLMNHIKEENLLAGDKEIEGYPRQTVTQMDAIIHKVHDQIIRSKKR